MSLSGIRTSLDNAISNIQGLNHYRELPSVVNPPFAFCALRPNEPVTYDFTAGNATLVYHFYIEVGVNLGATKEQAQDDLDQYLQNTGDTSIKLAVESVSVFPSNDADVCRVMTVANYGAATYGGVEYLCVRLLVDIWAR